MHTTCLTLLSAIALLSGITSFYLSKYKVLVFRDDTRRNSSRTPGEKYQAEHHGQTKEHKEKRQSVWVRWSWCPIDQNPSGRCRYEHQSYTRGGMNIVMHLDWAVLKHINKTDHTERPRWFLLHFLWKCTATWDKHYHIYTQTN